MWWTVRPESRSQEQNWCYIPFLCQAIIPYIRHLRPEEPTMQAPMEQGPEPVIFVSPEFDEIETLM